MDPKDEKPPPSSPSPLGDSPSPAVHENGAADELITQEQAKEEEEVVKESTGEARVAIDDKKSTSDKGSKSKREGEKPKSRSKKDSSSKSHDKSGKSCDKSGHGNSMAVSRIDDESRWICRMGNESTIIHTDDVREVVISRGEQLITLKPIGKAHMGNWSVGKKELFRKHQCKVGEH
jgi:hypothetical protein